MKISERELKKEAKITHNEILKKNEKKFEQFVEAKYGAKKSINTYSSIKIINARLIFSAAASLVLIVALAVSLWVIFTPKDDGGDILPKQYVKENEVAVDVNFAQISEDMLYSKVELDSKIISILSSVYDSTSNDHLYYVVGIDDQDNFLAAKLFIVANKDYDLFFYLPEQLLTVQINGFKVDYTESTVEEDGIYLTESKAVIITGNETIYIDYSGYSLEEQSNFLNWLESTIKAK